MTRSCAVPVAVLVLVAAGLPAAATSCEDGKSEVAEYCGTWCTAMEECFEETFEERFEDAAECRDECEDGLASSAQSDECYDEELEYATCLYEGILDNGCDTEAAEQDCEAEWEVLTDC